MKNKENILKRVLACMMVVVMTLTAVPMSGFVGLELPAWSEMFTAKASVATSGLYTYNVSDGKATIVRCYTSISGEVTIPSRVGGYPVIGIGSNAFEDCTRLTSVTIPYGVVKIESGAFSGCEQLSSVSIPGSVLSIEDNPFISCLKLKSINVDSSNSVYSSSNGVLFNKDKTSICCYPAGLTTESYSIPSSVKTINSFAFVSCVKLTNILIPNSVTSIENDAFHSCNNLKSITIPDSVTSIGSRAFLYCLSLTSITIPGSVTSIGDSVFGYCTSLTSVTIMNNVTSIEENAFTDCTSLTSITIPSSVTSIGENAFYNTGLYNDNNNWKSGVLYVGNYLIRAKDSVSGSYEVRTGTRCIADYAFKDCSSLTSVTIPGSVTSIGRCAFYYCTRLTGIAIPNSVTSIGNGAFSTCLSLASVTLSKSLKNIGVNVFYNCKNLSKITIPDSVTSIGSGAFSICTSLTDVTIPKSVTSIGDYAFDNCTCLTSITMPDSVTSIGAGVFEDCSNLTSVTIPGNVTSIGDYTFKYCTGLTSVMISNRLTNIGDGAFFSCSSLANIKIPDSVTRIGDNAFCGCTNLNIEIGKNVASIGSGALDGCRYITVISGNSNYSSQDGVLYNKAKTLLLKYPGANSAVSFAVPEGVTGIDTYSFSSCKNLETVYLPKSLQLISDHGFSNSNITSVYFANTATEIFDGKDVFPTNTKLYGEYASNANVYAQKYGRTFNVHVHQFNVTTVKKVTCTGSGVEKYSCTCGYVYEKAVSALGHKYSTSWTVDKQPTCTTAGSKSHHCTRCSAKKDVTAVAASGHKLKMTVTPATTTKNGKTVKTCTVCKKQISSQTIYSVKTVSLSKTVYYCTGKTVTPSVTVKDSKGKTLKNGTDYTVTYPKSRKNPGTYSVKVTFKGNYSGSKTLKFKIQPGTVTGLKKINYKGYQLALQWNGVTKATGYEVQQYDAKKKKWVILGVNPGTRIGFKKMSGTNKWRIRAVITVGNKTYYGDYSKTLTTKS